MAKCEICGKGVNFGLQVSHSNRKSNRSWSANVKNVRANIDGTIKSINICTKCLRSNKIERA